MSYCPNCDHVHTEGKPCPCCHACEVCGDLVNDLRAGIDGPEQTCYQCDEIDCAECYQRTTREHACAY